MQLYSYTLGYVIFRRDTLSKRSFSVISLSSDLALQKGASELNRRLGDDSYLDLFIQSSIPLFD